MAEATFSSYAQALNEDLTFHDLIQEAQRALQDSCSTEKKCDNCGGHMLKFYEGEILPPSPLINDVTEGQWADYMAAAYSGDWGDWSVQCSVHYCPQCRKYFISEFL